MANQIPEDAHTIGSEGFAIMAKARFKLKRTSKIPPQGGNDYGKEDGSEGVFEGIGSDGCRPVHGSQDCLG